MEAFTLQIVRDLLTQKTTKIYIKCWKIFHEVYEIYIYGDRPAGRNTSYMILSKNDSFYGSQIPNSSFNIGTSYG